MSNNGESKSSSWRGPLTKEQKAAWLRDMEYFSDRIAEANRNDFGAICEDWPNLGTIGDVWPDFEDDAPDNPP